MPVRARTILMSATTTHRTDTSTGITVVLCTYNRCEELARALESIAASKLPESARWEVVVVDNNSTDETRAVVQKFLDRYPGRFRYLQEPQQGLSFARNTGVRNAFGEYVAFTDDDIQAEPAWLQNLVGSAERHDCSGVG